MTHDELVNRCRVWQQRLGLRDWHIDVLPAEVHSMAERCELGRSQATPARRRAQLMVLPAEHADQSWHADEEMTLVHELIHVLISPFEPEAEEPDAMRVVIEQAINALAGALVTLAREARTRS